jgi:CheY-like chemotaxis protein/HPt (histidine-containing phosphotransfer) domain-containing protein
LQGILTRWQALPKGVEGAEQALAELVFANETGDPYQLILTDMHMPKTDGFALVEQIRGKPGLLPMTVMMLTSAGHQGDAERCRELGIAAYLYKPVRKQELLSSILSALGQHSATARRILPSQPQTLSKSLHILLAEDNRVNQKVAVRMLEKMGHSIVIASNGSEALSLLATQPFDLVLMDIQMPEKDGLTATEKIREGEKQTQSHLPIIAMTAHAMMGDRERCLKAGMDGYISKPINRQQLEETIRNLLCLQGDIRSDIAFKAEEPVAAGSEHSLNAAQILDRLGGDEKLFQEVVEIFLEEGPRQITSLRRAIAERDAAGLESAAHNLRGELGYLGISRVSQKARELEEMGRSNDLQHSAETLAVLESEISEVLISLRDLNVTSTKDIGMSGAI